MRATMRVCADAAEVARAAADALVASTTAAVAARGVAAVALAGGSTPRALYALLAGVGDPAYRARVPWQALHVFWGDERHVPPDHPDSNYRMAHEALLAHVPVPAAHVHRVRAEEADAARAAKLYAEDLLAFCGAHELLADGLPRLDLVLLGMGADGHTASIFPGTDVVRERARAVRAVWVPRLGVHRITLTPPVLNAAAAVLFLVTGADKAQALRAVLEGARRPDLYPSQTIAPARGTCLWLVDRPAAELLTAGPGGRGADC